MAGFVPAIIVSSAEIRMELVARDDLALASVHRRCQCNFTARTPEENCRPASFECASTAAPGTRTFHLQFAQLCIRGPRRRALLGEQKRDAEHLAPGPPLRQCFAGTRCHK